MAALLLSCSSNQVLLLDGFDPLGSSVNPGEKLADALRQGLLGVAAAVFASGQIPGDFVELGIRSPARRRSRRVPQSRPINLCGKHFRIGQWQIACRV